MATFKKDKKGDGGNYRDLIASAPFFPELAHLNPPTSSVPIFAVLEQLTRPFFVSAILIARNIYNRNLETRHVTGSEPLPDIRGSDPVS